MKKIKKNKKLLKTIKSVAIICCAIIMIELIIIAIVYINSEKNITYIDTINDISLVDNSYYLVSGSSNFKYSNFNKKSTYKYKIDNKEQNIIKEQAKLVKYDLNMNIIWEKTFINDYDATYYSAIKVDDGYIAVGSYVSKYSQISSQVRDGLIVKYDLEGNVVWHKSYQVLGDTEFYKVISENDGYIVVGQSIYENMEVGNHISGGGIIVKYDLDGNVVAKNNYGGNKSGKFNDVIAVKDGYIVCGKDATNYGILVKFKKDFNRAEDDENLISKNIAWYRTYSHTDELGFIDMELYNDKIYLAGASNVSNAKDDDGNIKFSYDAGMVIYDINGKYIHRYTYGGSGIERYNSITINNDGIYLVGSTNSNDLDITNYKNSTKQTGLIVEYDFDNEIVNKKYFAGGNSDVLSRIIQTDKDNLLIAGYSNSKLDIKNSNGKDYIPIFLKYNEL